MIFMDKYVSIDSLADFNTIYTWNDSGHRSGFV